LVVDRDGHFSGHGEEPGADVARHLARQQRVTRSHDSERRSATHCSCAQAAK
jgi:hypothetical protein